MRRARRLVLVVGVGFLISSSLAAAAAPTKYQLEMKLPGGQIAASIAAVEGVTAKSLRYPLPPTAAIDAATRLDAVRVKLRAAASHLRAIDPPTALAKQHALLLAGAVALRAELGALIPKLRGGHYQLVSTLTSLRGVLELESGLAGLRKAGAPVANV